MNFSSANTRNLAQRTACGNAVQWVRAALGLAVATAMATGCGSEDPTLDKVNGTFGVQHPFDYRAPSAPLGSVMASPFAPFAGQYEALIQVVPERLLLGQLSELSMTDATGGFGLSLLPDALDALDASNLLPSSALDAGFRWRKVGSSHPSSLDRAAAVRTTRHELVLNNIALVGFNLTLQAQTGDVPSDEELQHEPLAEWAYGSLPELLAQGLVDGADASYRVGHFHYSSDDAARRYAQMQGYDPRVVHVRRPAYFAGSRKIFAAYELHISAERPADNMNDSQTPAVPLRAYMDAETGALLEQTPLAFHLDGFGRGYRENSIVSKGEGLIDLPLPALNNSSGHLDSAVLSIKTCDLQLSGSTCRFGASAANGDFRSITPEDPKYDEVVAYYSTSRAMSWYRGLMGAAPSAFALENVWGSNRSNFGLDNPDIGKLTVYVRAMTRTPNSGTTLDNAVYLPGGLTGTSSPEIVIGTGWEEGFSSAPRSLRNIGKDGDVSMHEFGHHIVFRTISEIKGQALGMHEGFADYFTYAATGNNFLAESVVASAGASFLRAANRTGTLADYPPTSSTPPHAAGEFWSTVLWDIRTSLGPWQNGYFKFDKIVYHAIDLMRSNETYYGAIAALLRSAEIFASSYGDDPVLLKEKILAEFHKRGFVQQPRGDGSLPPATALLAASTTPTSVSATNDTTSVTSSSKKKNSSFLGIACSVAGSSRGHGTADLGTLLLLVLLGAALTPSIRRTPSGALAPARRKDIVERNR